MCNNKKLLECGFNRIDVNLEDIVLTPLTCATLVSEILKCLIYQKSQIPYPYNWLRCAIKKKRNESLTQNLKAFNVERNFQEASRAFDTVEDIMENIRTVFEKGESHINEVLLVFGTTPITPKEIFSIKIPNIARGHNEMNHKNLVEKNQHNILRKILLSEVWLKAVELFLPSTNLYIFINVNDDYELPGEFFCSNFDYSYPPNIRMTEICVRYDEESDSCCENLKIFEDSSLNEDGNTDRLKQENTTTVKLEGKWYQATLFLKGFKDCFVNKTSASHLW